MALLLGLYGCGGGAPAYPFGEFEELQRSPGQLDFPPVIVVPGIKGSVLVDNDDPEKVLWGISGSNILLHTFDELALPPGNSVGGAWDQRHYLEAIDPLGKAQATEVLEEFVIGWRFLPLHRYAIYKELIEVLQNGPVHLRRQALLFPFPYDWRLDNRVSAVQLAMSLPDYEQRYLNFQAGLALGPRARDQDLFRRCLVGVKTPGADTPVPCRARWERLKETGALDADGNVRFTIVAHSMGGLVSRYLVEGLGYKGRVNKLILFGTPNLGAMDALRAVVEGEPPDSVMSLLGLSFFDKGETRKIYLSFGSIFQLLPRYPQAVTNREREDIGTRFGLDNKPITDEIIREWKSVLLPFEDRLQEYFPDLDGYLRFQLESARCFHKAIQDLPQPCPDEDARIHQITQYLDGAQPTPTALPQKGAPQDPPTLILGGHCIETLTELEIDGATLQFHEGIQPEDAKSVRTGTYFYGDGRVPVKSLDYPHAVKAGDGTFLLCKDHMDIVKDKTLQYNLLRAIFKAAPLT